MPDPFTFHGFIIWAAMWLGGAWLLFAGLPMLWQWAVGVGMSLK